MALASVCSVKNCKRAATCLCLHCNKKVCSKHFNDHQTEIINELLPLVDRVNCLKMKLRTEEHRNVPLDVLKKWRDEKYREIDREYDRKVEELNRKISKQESEISQIINKIETMMEDGEASFEQVKQLTNEIQIKEHLVNKLMMDDQTQISSDEDDNELNLVNSYVQIGSQKVFVKAKVICDTECFYALESDIPFRQYDGLCPNCRTAHIPLQINRGYYAACDTFHEVIKK